MLYVGTSGWQYDDWANDFYPRGLARRLWLPYYAERFPTVEINNTFYRLPKAETVRQWADVLPRDFVVTVKMSRYVTHILRLKDASEAIAQFFERMAPLNGLAGPTLIQLPPNLERDDARLADALDAVPGGRRVAVEFRHASWWDEAVYALLRQRDVALCLADRGSRPITPLVRTASWGYVRLHEGRARPRPNYGAWALTSWAGRVVELWPGDSDVYVYFNNDPHGCAVRNASQLARHASALGIEVASAPAVRQVQGEPAPPR